MTDNYYKIDDITNNNYYYKNDKFCITKYCTILLIDEDDHSKIFISEKSLYYSSNDYNDFGVDDYDYYDENYGEYDYYYDDYDNDYYYFDDDFNNKYCSYGYDYDYDDGYDKLVYYKKPFNYFERLVSVKNNIENWIYNDDYDEDITLIINSLGVVYVS